MVGSGGRQLSMATVGSTIPALVYRFADRFSIAFLGVCDS